MSRTVKGRAQGPLSRPNRRRGPAGVAVDLYASQSGFRFLVNFIVFGWLTVICVETSSGLVSRPGGFVLNLPGLDREARGASPTAAAAAPAGVAPGSGEAPPVSGQRSQLLAEAIGLSSPPPSPTLADYRLGSRAAGEPPAARELLLAGDAALRQGRTDVAESGLVKLKRAADAGLPAAMALYGLARLAPPAGLPPDGASAREWLRRAAQAGDGQAARILARAFLTGAAGYAAPDQARELFRRGHELADSVSSLALADLTARGVGGPADAQAAEQLLRIAAERGDEPAMGALGRYLAAAASHGLAPSYDEAVLWLTRAAGKGDVAAMETLGDVHMFLAKSAPAQDPAEGFAWYRRCAEAGRSVCHFAVGRAYALSLGVSGDLGQAWAHLTMARDAGVPRAAAELEGLERRMSPADRAAALGRLADLKQPKA